MKPSLLIATALALFLATQAVASVNITGTLTLEQNTFGPGFEGLTFSEAWITVDPLGTFDLDFGLLGETEFVYTWQAPAGQLIEIDVPTGFNNYNLFLRHRTEGTFVTPGAAADPFTPVLADASGDPLNLRFSSLSFSDAGGTNANAFLFYDIVPGQTYRFSSITATGTISADHAVDFNNVPLREFYIFGEASTLDTGVADPGQWVRLVAVPEPTSLALLGVGGLLMAKRRRRH